VVVEAYEDWNPLTNRQTQSHVRHPLPNLEQSARQFDSVCMFFVALVLFGKNSFEPVCLFVSQPPVDECGMLTNDKFLATTVTPQRSHFLEIRFRSTPTLFYGHCFHR
jgi:hypothetical protein